MSDADLNEVAEEQKPREIDKIVLSERSESHSKAVELTEVLRRMGDIYRVNPVAAVRGQVFIKMLHQYVGTQLDARLTKFARRRGIRVEYEATILGSTKPKDVDVAVVDPANGPLMIVGVRSQMSSIGNNVLGYYEGIVGECISLQDRFSHEYAWICLSASTYFDQRGQGTRSH